MRFYYTNLNYFYPGNIKKIERFEIKNIELEINYCIISTLNKRQNILIIDKLEKHIQNITNRIVMNQSDSGNSLCIRNK